MLLMAYGICRQSDDKLIIYVYGWKMKNVSNKGEQFHTPTPPHVSHMMHDGDMTLRQTAVSDCSVYPSVWSLKTQAV